LPVVSGSAISRNCCRNMLNLSMAKPSPMIAIEVRTQDKKCADLLGIAAIAQNRLPHRQTCLASVYIIINH
jgi:hypothetical protein